MAQPTAKQLYDEFERVFTAQRGDGARRALILAIAEAIAAHGRVPESLVPIVEEVVAAWEAPG